jgi:hypothetical protein
VVGLVVTTAGELSELDACPAGETALSAYPYRREMNVEMYQ